MNWITIAGIVLIAIGSLLTIYGPQKDSKKDSDELNKKLDDFKKSLRTCLKMA